MKSKIESILFVYGEPITIKKIAGVLKADEAYVKSAVLELQGEYAERGINILEKDGKVQMTTSEKNSSVVEQLVESSLSEELTPAALETLSVIAYKEPVSRTDIDSIRGVNSVFSLRALSMRGLIEKYQGGEDNRTVFYKTTLDFLKKLGIKSVKELPQYDELSRVSEKNNQ
ncbi:SMC-Scp complex subunit ScpB [Candidatus Azambacteria bacterium]|nr:SMC-Scp complex subunit ScpB [Candidatus Azambacteria bacterium]